MDMTIDLTLYEALTEAGVKPDAAHRVERQFEASILRSQAAVRAEMHEQLMTKADGLRLEATMHKSMTDLTWKLVSFVVAANSIMLAAFKYLG